MKRQALQSLLTSSPLLYPHSTMAAVIRYKLSTRILDYSLQQGTSLIHPTAPPSVASVIRCLEEKRTTSLQHTLPTSLTYLTDAPPSDTNTLPFRDCFYHTYTLLDPAGNPTMSMYESHRKAWDWWRDMTRKPDNLSPANEPERCSIRYTSEEERVVDVVTVERVEGMVLMRHVRSLNSCYHALLEDAWCMVEGKEVLKLHDKLVPYHVSVVGEGVTELAERVIRELQREGISVYQGGYSSDELGIPFTNQGAYSSDELGIPFTILLDTMSLNESEKGIVRVRDRDTHFTEPMNVNVLVKWLKLNLGFNRT